MSTDKSASRMAELFSKKEYKPKKFNHNDIVEGKVISKKSDELLVDLGTKSEGIVSGQDLEDEFNTFDKLEEGDDVLCSVVQSEDDRGFVVLSLSRASQHRQWLTLEKAKKEEKIYQVTVIGHNKGGLIVDFESTRGFIPTSHLDPRHFLNNKSISDLSFLESEKLSAKIIELDQRRNRIVLSERAAIADESSGKRKKRLQKLKEGDVVEGIVAACLDFGVFVDIGDGLDGLVYQKELSWSLLDNPAEEYSVGDKVKAKVLSVDPDSAQISLSFRALQNNPWEDLELEEGDIVKGTVKKIVSYGAFVDLDRDLEGLVHISEAKGPLEVGEKIEAKVVEISPEEKKISLSTKKV